jgi:hypothetical protein
VGGGGATTGVGIGIGTTTTGIGFETVGFDCCAFGSSSVMVWHPMKARTAISDSENAPLRMEPSVRLESA